MIARTWRGAVAKSDGDAYAEYMADTGLAGYVGTPSFLKLILEKADELGLASASLRRAAVSGEAFLPPGPWHVCVGGRYFETPSADPAYLYQNILVALDAPRGINNGEPFLHAAWIGAVEPKAGETVCHIGSGMGYYTALLSMLVLPGGRVEAFEIDENELLSVPLGANDVDARALGRIT